MIWPVFKFLGKKKQIFIVTSISGIRNREATADEENHYRITGIGHLALPVILGIGSGIGTAIAI